MADDEYATCAETYARLCIYDLDPDTVTRVLGIEPSRTQRRRPASDPRATVGRLAAKPDAWFWSTKDQLASPDVRRHIARILDQLDGRLAALDELRRMGARAHVNCYWLSATGHGGPTVIPDHARRLGALGLECWFDVYFHGACRDRPTFDRVEGALADGLTHSSEEDLRGFEVDLEEALRRCPAIESYVFKPRGPTSMPAVDVEATLASDVESLQALAWALRKLALEVGYQAVSTEGVEHTHESTTLRFATASPPNLLVTGRVVAGGPAHLVLAAQYERDFGPLPSRA